jgi:hypothetical protein
MDSSLVSTCPVVDLSADEEGILPVKNTFVHFGQSRRTLRSSQSEPADPQMPPVSKGEFLNKEVDYPLLEKFDECIDAETTDDCSELDMLSIQTPEMTPRCMESPVESLTTSPWAKAQSSPEKQHVMIEWTPQTASNSTSSPVCLELSSDPALCSPSFSFTLRLEDRGGLGVEFGCLTSCNHPVVHSIVPGLALDAWNKQCMFGNNVANVSRYVSPGDVLLSVNGKTACHDILYEIQEKLLLKMTFGRTEKWSIQRV